MSLKNKKTIFSGAPWKCYCSSTDHSLGSLSHITLTYHFDRSFPQTNFIDHSRRLLLHITFTDHFHRSLFTVHFYKSLPQSPSEITFTYKFGTKYHGQCLKKSFLENVIKTVGAVNVRSGANFWLKFLICTYFLLCLLWSIWLLVCWLHV